ncbi:hypothetical protein Ancab_026364 [Ancistrocladus abbreviatus]
MEENYTRDKENLMEEVQEATNELNTSKSPNSILDARPPKTYKKFSQSKPNVAPGKKPKQRDS